MHNNVNALHATELYTLKWLKSLILYYIYFTTKKIYHVKQEDCSDCFKMNTKGLHKINIQQAPMY